MPLAMPQKMMQQFIGMGDAVNYTFADRGATTLAVHSYLPDSFPRVGEAIVRGFAIGSDNGQLRRFIILSHRTMNLPLFFLQMGSVTRDGVGQDSCQFNTFEDRLESLQRTALSLTRTPSAVQSSVRLKYS